MHTTQKEPYITAQELNRKERYVVGHFNGQWVCQRVRDGLFINAIDGSFNSMIASLWRMGFQKQEVCFV